nr:sigma-54 dependent transcriptional regulator [uncultured Desulfobacter sp.]
MKYTIRILLVEDEHLQREMLRDVLEKEGYRVVEAQNGTQAMNAARQYEIDLAVLDYKMPGQNGLEVLTQLKSLQPDLQAIMVTAYGTIETAVEVMKAGAMDYITKPIDLDQLLLLIEKAASHRAVIRENSILRRQLRDKQVTQKEIIYKSEKMQDLIRLAHKIAPSDASVLIQGETGTGKELLAKLIHALSARADHPLITVNCSALPESLVESELFGHEKGAFTGAHKKHIGRFELADSGTLFMDELGELSAAVQTKLLRFLQEKEFQRVGAERTLTSDVRIISATNRNLKEDIKKGVFREDLFFRINVVTLQIPPLRERKDDIPALAEFFVDRFVRRTDKKIFRISSEAMGCLVKYDFPGNVRELENIIERAVVLCHGEMIGISDLPFKEPLPPSKGSLKENLEELESRMVAQALKSCDGHQTNAALQLGISERMLRYKLKKYGFK